MSKDLDLGAQAISKAVEVGLKSQLDAVEDLQVNISTDPAKLVQGEVDYVEIKGKGLVMKRDLRAESYS
ncbi:MAG: LmeA family phospholipid-binding protein [Leptolyngbyaceae cyanobacterium SL_1_1]|nr:LmeA family phospholipid-binding protein [Leptolyngbyaceae cyanobacterium SL_1_1]